MRAVGMFQLNLRADTQACWLHVATFGDVVLPFPVMGRHRRSCQKWHWACILLQSSAAHGQHRAQAQAGSRCGP